MMVPSIEPTWQELVLSVGRVCDCCPTDIPGGTTVYIMGNLLLCKRCKLKEVRNWGKDAKETKTE